MDAQSGPVADDATRSLVEKLKSARNSLQDRPDNEIQEALRQALRTALDGLSEAEADRRLDGARDLLVDNARQRERQVEDLQNEVRRLTTELETLRSNRQAGADSGDTTATLTTIREALRKITRGQDVTSESLGLPPSEARLFRLVRELLLFAQNFETGIHGLLLAIEVGPGLDSRMGKQQKKIIENRFRACLDDKEGSVQSLKEALARNSRFVLQLNDAYSSAIRHGTRALLDDLDPQPIIDSSQGKLGGLSFERAWKSFTSRYADVSSLPPEDAWARFYQEPFKSKLGDYMDTGGTKK